MMRVSFVTGRLVTAIGTAPAIAGGALLVGAAACTVFACGGSSLAAFVVGEALVGVGWNLQFVGATSALGAAGGGSLQLAALNDALVFSFGGAGALAGAPALRALGWRSGHQALAGASTGAVLLALAAQALAERRQQAAAQDPADASCADT